MKPHQASKKLGKRIYTLKELAQRDFAVTPKDASTEDAPNFNLVNIQEDLLDKVETLEVDQKNQHAADQQKTTPSSLGQSKTDSSTTNLARSIELMNHLIIKEIGLTAQTLDLEERELQAWIDLQVMAPKQTLLALLRLARANSLDPLQEEVTLALYEDSHWLAYITVEGYSKMLNRHPAFDGISFTQSEEANNGIPTWMECTIYRKDRSKPTVVREYFEEVKREQAIWQKMPRRMLRHKVMQQCARLAIG